MKAVINLNPFVKNRANYNLSKTDKAIKKNEFNRYLNQIGENPCLESEIEKATTVNEMINAYSKLDLKLLAKLSVLKASSFFPTNFNDFLVYVDQSIDYISCIQKGDPFAIEKYDHKHSNEFSIDLDLDIEKIVFDWGLLIRNSVEDIISFYLIKLFKNAFLELLEFVDCDKINKCIVPCSPENNPYKNVFVKIIHKTGNDAYRKFANKIEQKGKDINVKDVEVVIKDIINNIPPEELDCLLRGFKSSKIVKFIRDRYFQESGKEIDLDTVQDIMTDFPDFTDVIPVNVDTELQPYNPCGLVSAENMAKLRIMRQGKTEEEAEVIIQNIIQQTGERLNIIASLINNNPISIEDFAIPNSNITRTILSNSIDLLFDSIDVNRTSSQNVYKRILSPLGDACVAFYRINNDTENIGVNIEEIVDKLNEKIKEPDNSIRRFLDDNFNTSENFYSKYNLEDYEQIDNYSFLYTLPNIIVSDKNGLKFICTKNELIYQDLRIPLTYNIENDYIQNTERQNINQILNQQNDQELLRYVNIDIQNIISIFYNNLFEQIEKDIAKSFYFQEFDLEDYEVLNKTIYANIDYFSIEERKKILKEKLDV